MPFVSSQTTRESTTALATKKGETTYVYIKRVKSDSYLTYGQSCKTYMELYIDPPPQKKYQ
jgi:phenylpyruvate tautomerase PptA (4-oxalocrotonate tautomerase family)